MKTLLLFLTTLFLSTSITAQTGKPIRGVVVDNASGESLVSVTVQVLNSSLPKGALSDADGNFSIDGLPVGRYDIQASFIGYEPMVFREIVVSSGKEAFITISLKENINELKEVVIEPQVNKQLPQNITATTSARMLSVEEASRYAGGMDDPARLVSAFAGVAGSMNSNGIAIRGNSPQFLQWRLEGAEIPNPTHFSDITGVGGGIFTALSSQVLGNSDFFTGAFPAEYGNALSGVFDMQLRNGNRWDYEHTVQVGTLGVDVSSEGPFKKGGQSSYLFNYRYATMALADDLFPGLLGDAAGMRYQDLSFKLNFPTKSAGTFSVWGIGLIDRFSQNAESDTTKWESVTDNSKADFRQTMASGGIGHKYFFNNSTFIKTALVGTYTKNHLLLDVFDTQKNPTRVNDMKGTNWDMSLNSYINKKFSSKHTSRTGFNITRLSYDLNYNISPSFPNPFLPMENFAKSDGSTMLFSAFSNSTIRLNNEITANIGINSQYFLLNEKWTLEPRVGIKWQMQPKHSIGLAYGLHSRHEKLDYYFVRTPETGNEMVNKKLDFAKAHHIVFSYDWSLSENTHLKIEPYFQYLYDIPVARDSSFSIINQQDWYLNTALVSEGKGINYGIDVTLERYLADGYYYLLTGSIFQSRYTGGDGVWRNTRLNRNYVFNALGGKEWKMGRQKQNIFNVNLRASFQGGDRYSPIDTEASLLAQDAVYDTSRAYEKQFDPALITSFTVSYKMNKKKLAHEFAVKVINANGYQEPSGHFYNYRRSEVELYKSAVVIPNISYKVEF
ncbi:carboxypeptidase-like regulatory domain-containing protein [Dysgonomonas sp. ZJ709]|uniref:TonB-dependent receptor n=1 Tax=Dysgonomonas sp. ZJ709 TaxID=2709797 RepID=UPI0013ECE867|nr:carboxypeptidase-like regulatory domain-containing protein [Dysgonomonas sp. ZJ709]